MSCHSATANQVRLILHTAAFWLMHGVRAAIPQTNPLAKCEFATIRERLIKIAARVIEHVARIRVQLPTTCPDAALSGISHAASCLQVHKPRGCVPRRAADTVDQPRNALHHELPRTDLARRKSARVSSPDIQKSAASDRNRVSVLLAPVGGGDLGRLGRLGEKSAFDKHGRHGGFSQDSKASTLHPAIKRGPRHSDRGLSPEPD
jgi:hypothetical protein